MRMGVEGREMENQSLYGIFFLSRSPRATEGMHIFFSYAYMFLRM